MKRLSFAVLVLTPGVALAHGGAHLHPHGMEFGIGAVLVSLAVGGAVGALAVARVRGRK